MWKSRKLVSSFLEIAAVAMLQSVVADSKKPCCFTNTFYNGICTVIPGKRENCGSILSYLNNPISTGKSYCRSSFVRGGWVRVDCKTGKPITDDKKASGTTQAPQVPSSKAPR